MNEKTEEVREDVRCVVCGALLQNKAIGVVLDTHPTFDRKRDCTLGGFFTADEPEFLASAVCNRHTCLKSLLEELGNESFRLLDSFQKTDVIPGSWFGPNGCQHYLKSVYQTVERMLGWYDYASGFDGNQISQADQEIRTRLSHILEQTEAKPVTVSLVGGYGHLFDGWFHFCDAHCALSLLFDNQDQDEDENSAFFVRELSYSGLPVLTA